MCVRVCAFVTQHCQLVSKALIDFSSDTEIPRCASKGIMELVARVTEHLNSKCTWLLDALHRSAAADSLS